MLQPTTAPHLTRARALSLSVLLPILLHNVHHLRQRQIVKTPDDQCYKVSLNKHKRRGAHVCSVVKQREVGQAADIGSGVFLAAEHGAVHVAIHLR